MKKHIQHFFMKYALGALMGTLMLAISACSSISLNPTVTVRIESEPGAADVVMNGKNIGATPLDLAQGNYREAFAEPFLNITLEKPGFQSQNILISTRANQVLKLKFQPFTAEYFEKFILRQFQASSNQMVREALQVQGYIVANQLNNAEEKNRQYLQKYPNIAAGYVLQANIELAKSQKDQAIRNLERALSLDPTDATVTRMIQKLRGGTP